MSRTIAQLKLFYKDCTTIIEVEDDAAPRTFYRQYLLKGNEKIPTGTTARTAAPAGLYELAGQYTTGPMRHPDKTEITVFDEAEYARLLIMPAADLPGNARERKDAQRLEDQERWVPDVAMRREAREHRIITRREEAELKRRQGELMGWGKDKKK